MDRITTEKVNLGHKKIDLEIHTGFKRILDAHIHDSLEQDDDVVILITGDEGAGKSKLARQIGAYANHKINEWGGNTTFGLDNIHFRLDPYMETAKAHIKQKGWVNLLDEGRSTANRKRSTTGVNVKFTNYLSECRADNHIHIICLPAFHDIDSYIAIWRSKLVIKCEKKHVKDAKSKSGYSLQRGIFKAFKKNQALINVYYHKLRYIYPRQPVIKDGYFPNVEILDDVEAYQEKKRYWRYKDMDEEDKPMGVKAKGVMTKLIKVVAKLEQDGYKQKDIAQVAGCSVRNIQKYLEEYAMLREDKDEALT